MKAIIEFNLPEENDEYKIHTRASQYFSILWDIQQALRQRVKYGEYSEEVYAAYEEVYTLINDLIGDSLSDIS